jgi:DNA-binding transcriptional ArsR family regulator
MSTSQTDEVFRALSDPTRRAIVDRLSLGTATVSDLAEPFAMSLPAIHQHLQLLEGADLITTAKEGRVRTCRLNARALRAAEDWISRRRAMWERRLDNLGEHLQRQKQGEKP